MKRSWLAFSAGAALLAPALGGCGDPTDDAGFDVATAALGQPNGDYPSHDERVALYATNRARVDPAAEGWPAYPAQPPLLWHYDLNRSARAHSLDMRDTPCFQHASCDGTDTFVRIGSFYTGAMRSAGENIAAGTADPFTVVHNWIFEIGATPGETGHRDSIFSGGFTYLGNGFAAGSMPGAPPRTLANYWTQDFVGTTGVTRPPLADGIHFPRTVDAGAAMTFGTTYAGAGGAAPEGIFVVVDGACTPLALARGSAARGAYEAQVALADGCHGYFFVATAGGTESSYPDTGALQAGAGAAGAACALYTTERTVGSCGGTPVPTGAGGSPPTTTGAGGSGVSGPGPIGGACACSVPDGGGRAGAAWALLACVGLLGRRRRSDRA